MLVPIETWSQIGIDPPASRKPPVAILANGYLNCCLPNSAGNPIIDALTEMNAITPINDSWTVAWNNLYSSSDGSPIPNPPTDAQMLHDLGTYIGSFPDDQPIILMGHSFGGDTILKFLDGYRRTAPIIDAAIIFDAVQAGGLRSHDHDIADNVRYFYNRWQENQSPGFVVPDVAAIEAIFEGLTGISVLENDVYWNPFPLPGGGSGSMPNPQARRFSGHREYAPRCGGRYGLQRVLIQL
jgi:hypothetical protein